MNNETYLVRQERCPECARLGNDNGKNNLAVYSDGHTYCFAGHGLLSSPSKIGSFRATLANESNQQVEENQIVLPNDCDVSYPHRAIEWVGQYQLTRNDLLSNRVLWSESMKRLIFPVYGEKDIIAWQGRYFGEETGKVKWFGKGNLKDTFNILGNKSSNKLILVEDIISAIKVSRFTSAMPLYGNNVGIERFKRLYKLIDRKTQVVIWLDPDMRQKSITEHRRGILCGIDTRIIYSDKDPKEHNYEEIKNILT